MGDKDCSMCKWYDMAYDYCTMYREAHLPSDEGCIGWVYWEDSDPREERKKTIE